MEESNENVETLIIYLSHMHTYWFNKIYNVYIYITFKEITRRLSIKDIIKITMRHDRIIDELHLSHHDILIKRKK